MLPRQKFHAITCDFQGVSEFGLMLIRGPLVNFQIFLPEAAACL